MTLRWLPIAVLLAPTLAAQVTQRITTISGETLPGAVVSIGADGLVRARLIDGEPRDVPLDELDSIEAGSGAAAPTAGPGRIWLRSGVELGAKLAGGEDGAIRVDVGFDGAQLRFALVHVRALRLEAAEAAGDYDGFAQALEDPDATSDLLFAWNRRTGKLSRLSVHILGVEGDQLRVDYRGERSIPLDQVHGIVFGRDNGVRPPLPPPPYVTVELGDGLRLTGSVDSWSDGVLRLALPEGPVASLPVAAVHRVDVRSSRVMRLGGVAPTESLQTAAFERARAWLVDRAPGGPGLVLGGRTYARGLCLFPRTRLSWNIDPDAFGAFEATIGIDARSTGPADAVFRVLLDGQVALERAHVRLGAVETIRVPLGSAATVSIEADFGDNLDLGDHCVFADPRLLRL